jgi:hypothetical protein
MMMNLEIIERAEIPAEWLDTFKQYASVADNGRDALLMSMLTLAVLRVQEMADRSLLACTIRLTEDEAYYGVTLYQSVAEVISVKDAKGGEPVWDKQGRMIYTKADEIEVVYKTEPLAADLDTLLPVVYQYATALYDGEDSRTLANILRQCR